MIWNALIRWDTCVFSLVLNCWWNIWWKGWGGRESLKIGEYDFDMVFRVISTQKSIENAKFIHLKPLSQSVNDPKIIHNVNRILNDFVCQQPKGKFKNFRASWLCNKRTNQRVLETIMFGTCSSALTVSG